MNKRIVVLLILVLSVVSVLPAQAQEALQYGQPITAEMTAETYEFTYTFPGKQGDIIVVTMKAVDSLGELNSTLLTLQSPSAATVAEYDSFSTNTIFSQLPEDGDYTVIATRPDGAEGTSVGEFTLSVDLIPLVEIGASVTGTISSAGSEHYYAYTGATDFFISYAKSAGDFFPEVTINTIGIFENDGQLNSVGAMSGSSFRVGSIGTFTGGQTYIINLGEALFDFNFDEVTADYTVDVLDASKLQ